MKTAAPAQQLNLWDAAAGTLPAAGPPPPVSLADLVIPDVPHLWESLVTAATAETAPPDFPADPELLAVLTSAAQALAAAPEGSVTWTYQYVPCRHCAGSGLDGSALCGVCRGLGEYRAARLCDATTLKAAQQRYLSGPLVLHPGGWESEVPAWLRAAVVPARLAQLYAETRGLEPPDLATLEEACAHLSTASLVQPLSSDWAAIFVWLGLRTVSGEQARVTPDNLGDLGVTSLTRGGLSAYQWDLLNALRRDLRAAGVRHGQKPARKRAQTHT